MAGRVADVQGDRVTVDLGFGSIAVLAAGAPVAVGAEVSVSVRSELLQMMPPGGNADGSLQTIPANYLEAVYLGLTTSHLVSLPNGVEVAVRRISGDQDDGRFAAGQQVAVGWNTAEARLHWS